MYSGDGGGIPSKRPQKVNEEGLRGLQRGWALNSAKAESTNAIGRCEKFEALPDHFGNSGTFLLCTRFLSCSLCLTPQASA